MHPRHPAARPSDAAIAALLDRRSALAPDEVLLFRARAFPDIFDDHHRRVREAVASHGARSPVLEELTQEAFLRFFFGVVEAGFPDNIQSKLVSLAGGLAMNHRRKEGRNPVMALGPPSSTSEQPRSSLGIERRMDLRTLAQRLLPALSQEHRDVIHAIVLLDQGQEETAAALGISRTTLASRLAAAKRRLAEMAVLLLPESQRGRS